MESYVWGKDFSISDKTIAGDTMYKLSKEFGIPLRALIAANPQIANPDVIGVGELLNIPYTPVKTLYTVAAGDTMYKIATRFNVSLGNLIAVNPQVGSANVINVGQLLTIPQ